MPNSITPLFHFVPLKLLCFERKEPTAHRDTWHEGWLGNDWPEESLLGEKLTQLRTHCLLVGRVGALGRRVNGAKALVQVHLLDANKLRKLLRKRCWRAGKLLVRKDQCLATGNGVEGVVDHAQGLLHGARLEFGVFVLELAHLESADCRHDTLDGIASKN